MANFPDSKDYPTMFELSTQMDSPNEKIMIHEGEFFLLSKLDNHKVHFKGKIYFSWFPSMSTVFEGIVINKNGKDQKILFEVEKFILEVNGHMVGDCYLSRLSFPSEEGNIEVTGMLNRAVFNDRSVPVSTIKFCVPNLIDLRGRIVSSYGENDSYTVSANRLVFEDDKYEFTIDKLSDFEKRNKELSKEGGYHLLYSGELKPKKGSLVLSDLEDALLKFNTFLFFVNGRRTSLMFLKGIHEEETLWEDYSNYQVDQYKSIHRWASKHNFVDLEKMYATFSKKWEEEGTKEFLTSAIHWYVEANKGSGYAEGSLIMAQTALELLYNWLIIEQNGMLLGKDAESISAANKIRLLLSHIKIDYKVPDKMAHLKAYVDSETEIKDAPDAITQIRNAIVHSQVEKRKKISELDVKVIYQALHLSIWYIESSLLYILDYEGKYYNRTEIGFYFEEDVPWRTLEL